MSPLDRSKRYRIPLKININQLLNIHYIILPEYNILLWFESTQVFISLAMVIVNVCKKVISRLYFISAWIFNVHLIII